MALDGFNMMMMMGDGDVEVHGAPDPYTMAIFQNLQNLMEKKLEEKKQEQENHRHQRVLMRRPRWEEHPPAQTKPWRWNLKKEKMKEKPLNATRHPKRARMARRREVARRRARNTSWLRSLFLSVADRFFKSIRCVVVENYQVLLP